MLTDGLPEYDDDRDYSYNYILCFKNHAYLDIYNYKLEENT